MDRTFAQLLGVIFEILESLIPLLSFLVVALFFWGLVKVLTHAGDETKLKDGKRLMLWGLIGIIVVFSLWSIVALIASDLFGGAFYLPQLRTS